MEILQTSDALRGFKSVKRRSDFNIVQITAGAVWIEDLCAERGGLSVTNDVEGVCAELTLRYGERKIYYKDTDGRWDELRHDAGRFMGFRHGAPRPA